MIFTIRISNEAPPQTVESWTKQKEGGPEYCRKKRVKSIEAGNLVELFQAVAGAKEHFKPPAQTKVVFCYEVGRDGFYPYRRLTGAGRRRRADSERSDNPPRPTRRHKPSPE